MYGCTTYQCDILDDLLCHVFGVELGAELEQQRRLFLDVLAQNLVKRSLNIKN